MQSVLLDARGKVHVAAARALASESPAHLVDGDVVALSELGCRRELERRGHAGDSATQDDDPRLRVFLHDVSRGPGTARGTGHKPAPLRPSLAGGITRIQILPQDGSRRPDHTEHLTHPPERQPLQHDLQSLTHRRRVFAACGGAVGVVTSVEADWSKFRFVGGGPAFAVNPAENVVWSGADAGRLETVALNADLDGWSLRRLDSRRRTSLGPTSPATASHAPASRLIDTRSLIGAV